MMKITQSQLRLIIMEEAERHLRESPLDDFAGYSRGRTGYKRPSIGYKIITPRFVNDAKQIMSMTGDVWVIIAVDDTEELEEEVDSPRFKAWLESQQYAPDAKVLVVGTSPMEDDNTTVGWILHDILGHTAGKVFLTAEGFSEGAAHWLMKPITRRDLISRLHGHLRATLALLSGATDVFDMVYDVFGSIILGHLTLDSALGVARDEEQKELVQRMFESAQAWVDSIPSDGTQATIVKPW